MFDLLTKCDAGCTGPPNTHVALSSDWAVEIVNDSLATWRRPDLTRRVTNRDDCYLLAVDGYCSDPSVIWDPASARFFISAESHTSINFAVSATADPTGPWYVHSEPVPTDSIDNPRLVVSTDKVVIGTNGSQLWVYDKRDVLAATSSPMTPRTVELNDCTYTYGCIQLPLAEPTDPNVYTFTNSSRDTNASVGVITGTPGAGNVKITDERIALAKLLAYPSDYPLPAPQQGGPDQLGAIGLYAEAGAVRAGRLWLPIGVSCRPTPGSAVVDCVRLIEIDASQPGHASPVFDTTVGFAGQYLVDPDVVLTGTGHAVVVATVTSPTMHPSLAALAVRADGTSGPLEVVRPGTGYISADYYAPNLIRWGDNSWAVPDPDDADSVWVAGEYATDYSGLWGTAVAHVAVDDPDCPTATSCAPGTFRAVTPARVLDTRTGLGTASKTARSVASGTPLTLQLAGRGGIPETGAGAAVVTVTAARATAPGYVTAYAGGATRPATSTLNYIPQRPTANTTIVPLGPDGAITLTSVNGTGRTVDLIVDVTGYVLAGAADTAGGYVPLPPARLLDTRTPAAPVGPSASRRLVVAGKSGLPAAAGITAVAVTVTSTRITAPGYLAAYPDGTAAPTTSTLNYLPGLNIANTTVVPLGADGGIAIKNASGRNADIVIDVIGYFRSATPAAAGGLLTNTPRRILDTRTGLGGPAGAVPGSTGRAVRAAPAGSRAAAALINLTVTTATAPGYLTAYPTGSPVPATSTINYVAGITTATFAVVPLSTDGKFDLRNASGGRTHLIADLLGTITN